MASLHSDVEVKVYRLPKDGTIKVKIIPTMQFKARLWVGKILLRMAALALGCGIQIEEDDKDA